MAIPNIFQNAPPDIQGNSSTWELVKDSAGTLHLVPQYTPVPYGVDSRPIATTGHANITAVSLLNAARALGASAAQDKAIVETFANTGAGPKYWTVPIGGNGTPLSSTVTDLGIGALAVGIGGAFGAIGDEIGSVADPFVPGQTTGNITEPIPGEVSPNEEPGASDSPGRAAGKTAAGAAAGKVAGGLVTAGLLGTTGAANVALRVLLGLAGLALLLLGLQALTGESVSPAAQVRKIARRA